MKSVAEKILEIFEIKIPDYYKTENVREAQVQMAMDIAAFLDSKEAKKIMFVEAPVGTGKSLAALIPTVLATKSSSSKVVYATATISLQGQLMASEVPLLKNLSLVKNPILALGKGNYFCRKEYDRYIKNFTSNEQEAFLKFFNRSLTGQRFELEENYIAEISEDKWKKVSLSTHTKKQDCDTCRYGYNCPTYNHRSQFMDNKKDLVITNHNQLIASVLLVNGDYSSRPIVPTTPGIIIIDEAHHFIENFLSQIEQSFSLNDLRKIKGYIPTKDKKHFDIILKSIEISINNNIKLHEGSLQGRYRISPKLLKKLNELKKIMSNALAAELFKQSNSRFSFNEDWSNTESVLEKHYNMIDNLLRDNFVSWLNYEEKKFHLISEKFPNDLKQLMAYLAKYNKIIIMSGTLTMNGDFDALLKQWRISTSQVVTKKYETPFDYEKQALVYVPELMASPVKENFIEKCTQEIRALIDLTQGRSLILTTAKDHMNIISEQLKPFLQHKNIDLLVQEQSGVEKLTRQFKEDETSVLVGSGSFFSGFSVAGKSLISVILTKLPFPVHDDPFLELIGQGYEDDFFHMIVFPHMLNKLNQAAGRLIRDINDFGIFTIMDTRIFDKREQYGEIIIEDLENQGYKIIRSFEEASEFLQRKFELGAEARYKSYSRKNIIAPSYLWEKPQTRATPTNNKIKTTSKKNETYPILQILEKSNKNKATKKLHPPTQEQIQFAKEVAKEFKLKLSSSHYDNLDTLYKFLITKLYYEFEDTKIVEDNFPFTDEKEKKRLKMIQGSKRKVVTYPLCSKFGCTGVCTSEIQKEIQDNLKKNHTLDNIKFDRHKTSDYCTVIMDLGIVARYYDDKKG